MSRYALMLAAIRRSDANGYIFVLPYVIFFLAFVAYPLVFSFVLMFHRWNLVSPMEWVGLKNFIRLVQDPLFFRSLFNTLTFLAIHIPLQILAALGFALLLNTRLNSDEANGIEPKSFVLTGVLYAI